MRNARGQALVEFTLIFMLTLIIAWIPTDFGLGLYSAHIAQNASRDAARIAAADPTLPLTQTCTMPCSGAPELLDRIADRLRAAFLKGATITIDRGAVASPPTCDVMVTATVSGNYRFFFYRMLGWFGITTPANQAITRVSSMRWEHQC